MTVARLRAGLLGAAPPDQPMARLLALDEEALACRVRAACRADGAGTSVRCAGRDAACAEVRT